MSKPSTMESAHKASNVTLIAQSCDIAVPKTALRPSPSNEANNADSHKKYYHSIYPQHVDEFPSKCCFSPDGLCVLTATTGDNLLRLYNVPSPLPETSNLKASKDDCSREATNPFQNLPQSWRASLHAKENDAIRDYAWYPLMNSNDPSSCFFASTSREQPIHLWDAYRSQTLRASYCAFDHVDAIEAALCLKFSPDGTRIYAGYPHTQTIRVFHTACPGSQCDTWKLNKTRKSRMGQQGIPSAIEFVGDSHNIVAVGTYSGSIYVYDDRVPNVNETPITTVVNGIPVVSQSKAFARKRRYVDATPTATIDEGDDYQNLFKEAKTKLYQKAASGGITQLKCAFPHNPYLLLSASRRSRHIISWDLRMLRGANDGKSDTRSSTSVAQHYPIQGLHMFERGSNEDNASTCGVGFSAGTTNQHLEFDISLDGTKLLVPYHESKEAFNTRDLFISDDHDRKASLDVLSPSIRIYDLARGKLCNKIHVSNHSISNRPSRRVDNSSKGSIFSPVVINGISQSPSQSDVIAISTGTRTFDGNGLSENIDSTDDEEDEAEKSDSTQSGSCNSVNLLSNESLSHVGEASRFLQLLQVPI